MKHDTRLIGRKIVFFYFFVELLKCQKRAYWRIMELSLLRTFVPGSESTMV